MSDDDGPEIVRIEGVRGDVIEASGPDRDTGLYSLVVYPRDGATPTATLLDSEELARLIGDLQAARDEMLRRRSVDGD